MYFGFEGYIFITKITKVINSLIHFLNLHFPPQSCKHDFSELTIKGK